MFLLFSSKIALTGLFCGRNYLHRGMVVFLTVFLMVLLIALRRGATALPAAGCFLPPVDLVKE